MKKTQKKTIVKKFSYLFLTVSLIVSLFISNVAYALTNPASWYSARCWTYTYSAPATSSYNCLAFATGVTYWQWPWGSKSPSTSEVDTFMAINKGYSPYSFGSISNAKIIAYRSSLDTGSSVTIAHFAKVSTSNIVEAKWGQLERFTNGGSYSPYRTVWGNKEYYGPAIRLYK